MVRAAAKNHASVAVVTSPSAYRADRRRRSATAASPWPSGARWPRGRSPTSPSTTWRSRSGARRSWRPTTTWWPAFAGLALRRSTALRYGENPHQPAALYADPARAGRAGPGRAAARQGDVVQQLRRRRRGLAGGERLRRAGGGDHQARQPVRHRGRRRRRRGAPQGARVRPGVGVRRRDRGQPAGHGRAGRAGRRDLHRGGGRAGLRGRRGRGAGRRRRTSGCCGRRRGPPAPAEWRQIVRRRAGPDRRPASTPPATTRRLAAGRRRRPADEESSRPGVRLAGGALRSSPTRSCSPPTAPPSGVGMGQVNRVDSARLAVSRAGAERARGFGRRLRRVLPVRRRPAGAHRRRRPRGRPARRLGPRRRGRSRRPRRPASRCTSPAPATSSTEGPRLVAGSGTIHRCESRTTTRAPWSGSSSNRPACSPGHRPWRR